MKGLRLFAVFALAGALGVASGCKRDSGKLKVAFVSNNSSTFWTLAQKGTEQAEKDFGVEALFRMPNEGTFEKQKQIIEELIQQDVKGIAISPNNAKNAEYFLSNTNKKIPVITQDSDLPKPESRRCFIGTHNYRAGWGAGELVREALPGGGKIVIFVGQMDVLNARQRRQGVLDNLAGKKGNEATEYESPDTANLVVGKYTLLATKTDNTNDETCRERCEEILVEHPDTGCLIGLWEYNPPMMLVAVDKLVQAGKLPKRPKIVGFDENLATLKGIQEDKIVGTIVQDPYNFGYMSVQILKGMAEDKAIDDVIKGLKEKHGDIITVDDNNTIYVRHREISKRKGNVDDFYNQVKKMLGK